MGADEVLIRLSEMARADISEFINDYGGIDWDKVRAQGYLVKKVRHNQGKNSEVELHDALSALQLIGKHHKLFTEKIEHSGEIKTRDVTYSDDQRANLISAIIDRARTRDTGPDSGE